MQEARTRYEWQGTTQTDMLPHHTLAPHLHALCDTIPRCPVDFRIRDHLALLDRVLCLVNQARVYVSGAPIKDGMHMRASCALVCEGRERGGMGRRGYANSCVQVRTYARMWTRAHS